jgi:hypothetical protein
MIAISRTATACAVHLCLLLAGCAASGTIVDTEPAPFGTIHGIVTDEAGDPLAGIEVFVDRTARGAVTGADGAFSFADLPVAYYRVVAVNASGVPYVDGVLVAEGRSVSVSIAVDVEEGWTPRGSNGQAGPLSAPVATLLLGSAGECRIANPGVVDVIEQRRSGVLHRIISARGPVEVENDFAGYRLLVYPTSLDVYTQGNASSFRNDVAIRFVEMAPPSAMSGERWETNRRQLYLGSFEHFLRSLAARNLRADGFAVTRPFQSTHGAPGITGLQETVATWTMARDEQIVMGRPNAYVSHLNVPTTIRVSHRGASIAADAERYVGGVEVDDRPTSRLSIGQGMLPFTRHGLPLDESIVLMEGLWGAPRLCHQLPVDLYVPTQ